MESRPMESNTPAHQHDLYDCAICNRGFDAPQDVIVKHMEECIQTHSLLADTKYWSRPKVSGNSDVFDQLGFRLLKTRKILQFFCVGCFWDPELPLATRYRVYTTSKGLKGHFVAAHLMNPRRRNLPATWKKASACPYPECRHIESFADVSDLINHLVATHNFDLLHCMKHEALLVSHGSYLPQGQIPAPLSGKNCDCSRIIDVPGEVEFASDVILAEALATELGQPTPKKPAMCLREWRTDRLAACMLLKVMKAYGTADEVVSKDVKIDPIFYAPPGTKEAAALSALAPPRTSAPTTISVSAPSSSGPSLCGPSFHQPSIEVVPASTALLPFPLSPSLQDQGLSAAPFTSQPSTALLQVQAGPGQYSQATTNNTSWNSPSQASTSPAWFPMRPQAPSAAPASTSRTLPPGMESLQWQAGIGQLGQAMMNDYMTSGQLMANGYMTNGWANDYMTGHGHGQHGQAMVNNNMTMNDYITSGQLMTNNMTLDLPSAFPAWPAQHIPSYPQPLNNQFHGGTPPYGFNF